MSRGDGGNADVEWDKGVGKISLLEFYETSTRTRNSRVGRRIAPQMPSFYLSLSFRLSQTDFILHTYPSGYS